MKNKLSSYISNKEFFSKSTAIVAIVVFYILIESIGITCPIKFVTGISCAGCGMSRAWIAFLKMDYDVAFHYHPLFFLPPIALLVYLFRKRLNTRIYRCIMFTFVAIFVIMYISRMVIGNGDIVVFEPNNNIVARLVRIIIKKMGG